MVPYDVLVDPLSMPIHPVLEGGGGGESDYEIINEASQAQGEDEEEGAGREEEEEEVVEQEVNGKDEGSHPEENGVQEEKDGRKVRRKYFSFAY